MLIGKGLLLLLHPLICLIESGSSYAKERACAKDNARVISSRGGVGSLFAKCGMLCVEEFASFVDVRGVFVEEDAVEEKQAAVIALSFILIYLGNRRIYRKEERVILSVDQLLDHFIPNSDKKYPLSILMSLSHSKECRKQMVNTGALLFLQKLGEMDVDGAKKLQETIGRRKLYMGCLGDRNDHNRSQTSGF
ncbi:hypothetical protein CTI12_AA035160 [Artemisia annua]|uniref:ARM repeat superfamily protein n=1 Tax=Artemisia annua TaxID=35608 RepID=A0A2U1QFW2_ARTAN|nr:hypothetical protein CTI12_AA035160 [Artemisia annua]